jgi:hypothetical protein
MKQVDRTHRRQIGWLLCRLGIPLIAIVWATVSMAQSSGTAESLKRAAGVVQRQANWPQVGYNSARTSYNPFEKVLSRSTVRRLKEEWAFPTNAIVWAPAVVNGVAYSGTGYGDKSLYAVNASTGALLWKTFLGDGGIAWATVVNGTVYAGTGVYGTIYDASTGCGGLGCGVVFKLTP